MMMNKKAVSLMVSYVLLVSIVIIMSVSIFVWMKSVANVEPVVDCEDGTSLIVVKTTCDNSGIQIDVKNNGKRFNIIQKKHTKIVKTFQKI